MKTVPFVWAFAAATILSCLLSALFEVSWVYILGGFAVLYLVGLALLGVFVPSPPPHPDDLPSRTPEATATPSTDPDNGTAA